jgi:hypothetical protein
LDADRAEARATVVRSEHDPRVRPPRARVVVWLDEHLRTGQITRSSRTRNEVRLARHDGRWRVTGWTLLPDEDPR